MSSPPLAFFAFPGLALIVLFTAPNGAARAQATSAATPETSYVYFQRTNRHVKFSTPEVFQEVVTDLREYLSANSVVARTEDNDLSSGAELPLSAVQEMTRDSGAAYLLYVTVDRPMSKWLKVTVQCYDSSGRELWQEEASGGGGLSSRNAAHDALQKLREELDPRLGKQGLPRGAPRRSLVPTASNPEQTSEPTGSTSEERSVVSASETQTAPLGGPEEADATIRLANGTPVHLLLAESISSKSAKSGSNVKLQVLDDVKVGDLVVIANKAPATATIQTAEGAGRAWKKGSLLLKLDKVTLVSQQQQPLRAWNAVKGKDTGAGAEWTNAVLQSYGFALLLLPFAPLQHGNEAVMPRGTVLEAVINGDVLLRRDEFEAAQPAPAERRHGPASITFYYPDFGEGNTVSVWCGQVKVGVLKRGGKFSVALPSGRYWLRIWNSKRSPIVALDAEDGGEQFVSVITGRHMNGLDVNWRENFAIVPHDVGEAQSKETTSAKARNVQDTTKLDLSQLVADPRVK
jgi:hypothetical protein